MLAWSIFLLVSTYFKRVLDLFYNRGTIIAWREGRANLRRILENVAKRVENSTTLWDSLVSWPIMVALMTLQAILRLSESFLWHVRTPDPVVYLETQRIFHPSSKT